MPLPFRTPENFQSHHNFVQVLMSPERSTASPAVGLAFKLEESPYGQLTYVRMYQGCFKRGSNMITARTGQSSWISWFQSSEQIETVTQLCDLFKSNTYQNNPILWSIIFIGLSIEEGVRADQWQVVHHVTWSAANQSERRREAASPEISADAQ